MAVLAGDVARSATAARPRGQWAWPSASGEPPPRSPSSGGRPASAAHLKNPTPARPRRSPRTPRAVCASLISALWPPDSLTNPTPGTYPPAEVPKTQGVRRRAVLTPPQPVPPPLLPGGPSAEQQVRSPPRPHPAPAAAPEERPAEPGARPPGTDPVPAAAADPPEARAGQPGPAPAWLAAKLQQPGGASARESPQRRSDTGSPRGGHCRFMMHSWADLTGSLAPPPPPPSPPRTRSFLVTEQLPCDAGKPVVVLDLDETLVYARDGPIRLRPGVRKLMSALSGRCEAIVWTAGEREYAERAVQCIDPPRATVRHCVFRHPMWFDGRRGQAKELRLLGRPLQRTLMLDNAPDCVRRDVTNSVVVPDWVGHEEDDVLDHVTELVSQLISDMDAGRAASVSDFLAASPALSRRSLRTDLGDALVCHTFAASLYPHAVGAAAQRRVQA
eukprot:TRINITY_DN2248_c0_g3_i1.p1 TRINITY_DN2248_c0_g3~~TRINITY_DN2248_c0_g3_i1.p1  ORF type:complete len:466 (+),score=96.84 TRINITY_DN2248_c0_g3_i1:65-1399(+)